MDRPRRRTDLAVAGLVFVGFALRLAVIAWIPTVPVSDFWSYYQRAANLADHGRYEAVTGRADATFPPAYPMVLSALFVTTAHRLLAAKLLNCVLGAVSIVLLASIARRWFGTRTAIAAAAIGAFYPRYVLLPTVLAAENLFMPLFLSWILLFTIQMERPRSWRLAAVAGVLLGVLTLTRSVAYLLWIPWLFGLGLRSQRWGTACRLGLILLACQHLILAPWAVRNAITMGYPTVLNSVGGIDLFIGNNDGATGEWYEWPRDLSRIDPDFRRRSLRDQDRAAFAAAVDWMQTHPRQALRMYWRKWGLMFGSDHYLLDFAVYYRAVSPPWPPADVLSGDHALKPHLVRLRRGLDLAFVLLLCLALVGTMLWLGTLRRGAPSRRVALPIFVYGTALYFPAVAAVFHVATRYRWSLDDALVPTAAFALAWLLGDRSESGAEATVASSPPEPRPL